MRKSVLIFLLLNVVIVVFLVRSVFILLTLLVEDGLADAIHSADIPAPNSPLIESRPQLIPKIIHQTYANESVPEHWREAQQSCIDLHEDYEYKLWTDTKSREFIATEYPWFLTTFDNYTYPIQRADAIRYFVLNHFGGIYIDLDDGCNRRLDPLLSYPSWVRRTKPTGISNDAMGSVPHHPFFTLVIESLIPYNRNWKLPYITVMYTTGPLFLSVIWQEYKKGRGRNVAELGAQVSNIVGGSTITQSLGRWDGSEAGRVRILMADEYNQKPWAFFRWHGGSSWHGKDARLIFWMGKHWMLLTATGFLLAGIVGLLMWWVYGRILLLGGSWKKSRRRTTKSGDDSHSSNIGTGASPSILSRGTISPVRRAIRRVPSPLHLIPSLLRRTALLVRWRVLPQRRSDEESCARLITHDDNEHTSIVNNTTDTNYLHTKISNRNSGECKDGGVRSEVYLLEERSSREY